MVRIKRGFIAKNRRKKILKITKGYRGASKTLRRDANQKAVKALFNSYRHRKNLKRNMRQLWISRINAIVRLRNWNYHSFIWNCRTKNYYLNRKVLAQLAVYDKESFFTIF
uniref:Large ribosomal subunit protein bL20c n=2 Tax=Bryopsidineae TaxID=2791029 RepID=A0A0D6E232_BRYPL|nr:50S ribosomal protein L20 [Bryopsis plumosa]AJF21951.1 ribosomal protein L20 [Codium decorticatum]CEO91045.1 50S ribosomal protein L20 [Bryopsis plumosa]